MCISEAATVQLQASKISKYLAKSKMSYLTQKRGGGGGVTIWFKWEVLPQVLAMSTVWLRPGTLWHHYRAKTYFWNLKGYLQTVFFVWKLVENKMFWHFLEKLYHFKVPKKVKIGEKCPKV